MRFTPDVARGDWILPRLRGGCVVGGVVPRGFEAYARILHHLTAYEPAVHASVPPETLRWSEAAALSSRLPRAVVHTLVQWASIAGGPDSSVTLTDGREAGPPMIGAHVTCNSYRNPELLADMARTVDHISGGRLILGIGAGWKQKDYDQFGYEFGTPGTRLADLAEAMPRIAKRLAVANPAPTRDIPILIGGGGEKKTLRIVAEHADIWHSFGDVETLTRKSAILDEHGATVGRDTANLVERSVEVSGHTPAEVADGLVAAGATLFTVGVNGPDYDLTRATEWVAWRDAQR
jgi:probable F420-dependent oxidoreductase